MDASIAKEGEPMAGIQEVPPPTQPSAGTPEEQQEEPKKEDSKI